MKTGYSNLMRSMQESINLCDSSASGLALFCGGDD
jgi:hypothetical protein